MVTGHGNDKYQYAVEIRHDFSSNIPNCFSHDGLFAHLKEQLSCICDYPNPSGAPLDTLLAQRLDISKDQLCITNGATEAIYLTAQSFHGCKSAILYPTFSEYADACRMHEHNIISLYDLKQIPNDVQLVWFCNPNNPTGSQQEKEEVLKLVETHPEVLFVIDQSYECLTQMPVIRANEAVHYPNLLLLHSLTKEYAIPGLRLGYLTANELLIKRISSQRMPWSVNQLAIKAGCYVLQHEEEYDLDLEGILQERDYVSSELKKIGGMEVWPSETNFILVQLRVGKAPALKEFLVNEYGILIRDCSNFEGLDDRFFRIAVQRPEENEQLLDALSEWMKL